MEKRPALGKGLSALIPDAADALDQPRASLDVDIDLLEPNHYQPRGAMDDERLDELAQSIGANGVIQPIVVRRTPASGGRHASAIRSSPANAAGGPRSAPARRVSGRRQGRRRRRQRAAARDGADREHPARGSQSDRRGARPISGSSTSSAAQEDVAAQVGKDRATVANNLRLLKLPEEVRGDVASGALSMGHARAIVALAGEADQRRMARDVIARGLSVRETEALVKALGDKRGADSAGQRRAEERRAHARGRRTIAPRARHPRRDQTRGQGRDDGDRLCERGRSCSESTNTSTSEKRARRHEDTAMKSS